MSAAPEGCEFGTTKNRGLEKILVHHVVADLRVTVEREVQRKAMMRTAEAEEQS